MKKCLFLIALLPSMLFAQYNGERSTEQSFEYSDVFFQSHYLNTFGMNSFKDVSAGLIDDPFLNLYLNPANLPQLGENNTLLYLDFRGDRTSAPVVDNYVRLDYFAADRMAYMPVIDPRWNSVSRSEPEPTFTVGILTYPVPELTNKLFVGATYQFIRREEKFYTLPYWIYNSRYYYDSFGNKAEGAASVPIQDRFSGKDEMITTGHLYSAFAGYKFDHNWSAGIGINGVIDDRKGGYLNASSDEYGNTDKTDWENNFHQDKIQNYNHFDLSLGVNYSFNDNILFGAKAGMLNGKAEQDYTSGSYNLYVYNEPSDIESWSNSYSNASTVQNWVHDGKNKYFGFNFNARLENGRTIAAYYKYSDGSEDFTSSSAITDTSFYQSRYVYDNNQNIYTYLGKNSTKDFRTGSGSRSVIKHEAMLRFSWKLNSYASLTLGGYWNNTNNKLNNSEPVNAYRYYEYHSSSQGQYPGRYDNFYELTEIKNLEWEYSTNYWSFQIPILVNFDFRDNFGIMLGINRIIKGWEIKDKTTAYFTSRKRNEDGSVKEEKNFGERYTQPDQNVTENSTKLIAKFYASVSETFKINLLVDPEFDKQFRIAQWWLSFELNL